MASVFLAPRKGKLGQFPPRELLTRSKSNEERYPFNYSTAQTLKVRAPWKTPKRFDESLTKTVNNEQVHRHEFSKSM